ncbi:zf-HC2 domain-containing protein [Actinomadura gamaensis]|uniref:Zf-HC2 domain-containing protein n=1 Tax=Actinomadura gamaensis TaxID=1763541 RepID=A0ABV9U9L5_9ACTN
MNDCGQVRTALGVYVLGAIDPAERARVDEHLATCPECRDELAALAGLPALLGRVDTGQIDEVSAPAPGVLDGLLARAAAERSGPWYRRLPSVSRAPLAAAAAVIMVVGLLLGGVVGHQVAGTRPQAGPPPSSSSEEPGEKVSATNPSTHVTASVVMRSESWGTYSEITVTGVPKGNKCRWYVITRSGKREMLGSWYVSSSEGEGEYEGNTMYPRNQIASFEVDTLEGHRLVTIPA